MLGRNEIVEPHLSIFGVFEAYCLLAGAPIHLTYLLFCPVGRKIVRPVDRWNLADVFSAHLFKLRFQLLDPARVYSIEAINLLTNFFVACELFGCRSEPELGCHTENGIAFWEQDRLSVCVSACGYAEFVLRIIIPDICVSIWGWWHAELSPVLRCHFSQLFFRELREIEIVSWGNF